MAIINAEGTPGGALYRAVNKVADGLKDEFPNVAVDTLAYQWGRPAPKITKVPLDAYVLPACSLSVLCLEPGPSTVYLYASFGGSGSGRRGSLPLHVLSV